MRHEVDAREIRRIVEVERRRHDLVADGQHAEDRLDGAGRAEQMADRRPWWTTSTPSVGALPDQALHGGELDLVAERRRGAMGVDVVDRRPA